MNNDPRRGMLKRRLEGRLDYLMLLLGELDNLSPAELAQIKMKVDILYSLGHGGKENDGTVGI